MKKTGSKLKNNKDTKTKVSLYLDNSDYNFACEKADEYIMPISSYLRFLLTKQISELKRLEEKNLAKMGTSRRY